MKTPTDYQDRLDYGKREFARGFYLGMFCGATLIVACNAILLWYIAP